MMVAESTDKSKNGMGSVFGLMAFLYFGGTIVGSLIVLFLDLELHQYLIITIGLLLFDWILNITVLSETHHPIKNRKDKKSIVQVWKGIFKNSKIKVAMIFLTLDIFVWGITGSVYKAGLNADFGVGEDDFAMMQLVFSISMMIFQIPAGKLTDKIGIKKSLILSISFGLVIFPIFIITSFLWDLGNQFILFPALIISQILWAATASTFIPSEGMILTDLDESRKAESHGIVSFVRGFGGIPTGIIGGFLIHNIHFIAPFILSTVGLIFEIWYIARHGHEFEIAADHKHKEVHIKPSSESVSEIELTEI